MLKKISQKAQEAYKNFKARFLREAEVPPAEQPAPDPAPPATPEQAPPKMKQVGEEMYPASDFLSVPDAENPETWALQVRKNGELDAELLTAAQASLMAADGGYMGDDKPAMIEALKTLYTEAGLEWPGSTPAECLKWAKSKASSMRLAEMYLGDYGMGMPLVPWGARTFADIDAANAAHEAVEQVQTATMQLCELVSATVQDSDITDKLAAFGMLTQDYLEKLRAPLSALSTGAMPAEEKDKPQGAAAEFALASATEGAVSAFTPAAIVQFRESASCAISVIEAPYQGAALAEAELGTGRRGPIDIEVIPIVPGPGNPHDNNYYPAEMLKRTAHKMVGAPMYATDHKEADKSEKTKTAVVRELLGFTDNGAPRLRVTVTDPDHAEKIRNQRDSGTLDTLECSIYASGISRPAEVDGKKRNVVEDIEEYRSIDWVTKAGAGGHVSGVLSESANGAPPTPKPASILSDSAVLSELSPYLAMSASTKTRILQAAQYPSKEAVHEAAKAELAYLRENSGRAPNLGGSPADNGPAQLTEKEIAGRINRINQKYLGSRAGR